MKHEGSSNERYIWAIFLNCPGEEAKALYEIATKIMTGRNLIKPPRIRAPKKEKV